MLYGPAIEAEVQYRREMARRLVAEAAMARELRQRGAAPASGTAEPAALVRGGHTAASAWRIAKSVIHATLAMVSFARTAA